MGSVGVGGVAGKAHRGMAAGGALLAGRQPDAAPPVTAVRTEATPVALPVADAGPVGTGAPARDAAVVASLPDIPVAIPEPGRPRDAPLALLRGRKHPPAASVTVRPPGGGSGRLTLNAEPWAEVTLDRKPIGKTPILGLEVPEGRHHVLFLHPQLGSREEWITVRGGEAVSRSARLSGERPPAPRTGPQ